MRLSALKIISLLLALPFLAAETQACAVCFGDRDSPLTNALNMMIFVMLGFLLVVLSAFIAFIVHLARRARRPGAKEELLGQWMAQNNPQ